MCILHGHLLLELLRFTKELVELIWHFLQNGLILNNCEVQLCHIAIASSTSLQQSWLLKVRSNKAAVCKYLTVVTDISLS